MSLLVTCKDGEFSFKITPDDASSVRVSGASSVTVTMDNPGPDDQQADSGKKSDASDAKEAASILDEDEYLAGEEDGEDVDAQSVATPKAPQYIGGPAPVGRNGNTTRTKDHTK